MIQKLNDIKIELRKRVMSKAQKVGANALIGIDFESSRLGDLLMVSMTATAVRIEKIIDPLPITESSTTSLQHEKELAKKKYKKPTNSLFLKGAPPIMPHKFNPNLQIGQEISNAELVSIFKCGNMGGMRRSHATNTLVIVSDYTKGLYHDKWIGGVLHYTGMGKNGDQDIHWAQNGTLANCNTNGVDVHLFEVMDEGRYTYCGRIELVDKPYTETQPGEDGIDRLVWMFPIRPVPENDVKKPSMFVFKDMDDYRKNGKRAEDEYNAGLKKVKKSPGKVAQRVRHKKFGEGTVVERKGEFIIVQFGKVGRKQLNFEMCVEKGLIEFI